MGPLPNHPAWLPHGTEVLFSPGMCSIGSCYTVPAEKAIRMRVRQGAKARIVFHARSQVEVGSNIPFHEHSPRGHDCTSILGVADVSCYNGACRICEYMPRRGPTEDHQGPHRESGTRWLLISEFDFSLAHATDLCNGPRALLDPSRITSHPTQSASSFSDSLDMLRFVMNCTGRRLVSPASTAPLK